MQFTKIFGVNYYLIVETCPTWVQHALRLITDRWGNDLDAEQSTGAVSGAGRRAPSGRHSPDPLGCTECLSCSPIPRT